MTNLIRVRLVALTIFVMVTLSVYWKLLQQFSSSLLLLMVPPILFLTGGGWTFLWAFILAIISKVTNGNRKLKTPVAVVSGLLFIAPSFYLIVLAFEKPSWVRLFLSAQIDISNSISMLPMYSWLVGVGSAVTIITLIKKAKTTSQSETK